VAAFRAAVENGDLHGLLDVLAPMRSWWPTAVGWRPRCDTRSPGRRAWPASWWAWPRPGRSSGSGEVWLNGTPALRVDLDGEVGTAITLAVAGARVTRIYAVRNPHKPSRPGVATRLTRTSRPVAVRCRRLAVRATWLGSQVAGCSAAPGFPHVP